MKMNVLTGAVMAAGLVMAASSANAAMKTDGHGNVGYDTYEECVAAIEDGSAKFYTPYTYQQPKRQAGEASVKKMRLSDVAIPKHIISGQSLKAEHYKGGACDLGVGQSNGRYGVSGALVGKYVPIAADMPVNVYMDKKGNPVRVTMQQCDNHFSNKFPMPVAYTAQSTEAPAPDAEIAIQEARTVEPIVVETNRVIRPSTTGYRVKEVIVAPESQIKRVNTNAGTAIAIEDGKKAVVVGQEVDEAILNDTEIDGTFPVIQVPNAGTTQRLVEADADEVVIIE